MTMGYDAQGWSAHRIPMSPNLPTAMPPSRADKVVQTDISGMASAMAMPLITLWTTIAALVGGMLAADIVLGITPSYFINNLPRAVMVSNLWLAMGKSVVFGLLIALIGCHYGLRVKPNTESLGQGTTASVVTSITVVILIDALFAVIFKNIGI